VAPKHKSLVLENDILGNHPHQRHYRELHPTTLLVNLDVTLQLISEAMLNRSVEVGERIMQIFKDGDTNHDGVLSFTEFMDIVKAVAPEYHERKILKMFREALMTGTKDLSVQCKKIIFLFCTHRVFLKKTVSRWVFFTTL
jgi:Ca2+-binding EF-hand superfamily protein